MHSAELWGGIINYGREREFTHVSPCTTRKASEKELAWAEEACRNIPKKKHTVFSFFSEKDALSEERLKDMLNRGMTQAEIAEETGIEFHIVGEKIIRYDLVDQAVMNEELDRSKQEHQDMEISASISISSDIYYSVSAIGTVEEHKIGENLEQEEFQKIAGNFFLNRSEAEKRAKRIQKLFC